jgi:hypothetical protein
MYLEGILIYVKYKNIFLVADRCILNTPKYLNVFNAFGYICSVLQYIGSIFQCILIYLKVFHMY